MGDGNIQLSCILLHLFSILIRVRSEGYGMEVRKLKFHSNSNNHTADPIELAIYKGYILLDQPL